MIIRIVTDESDYVAAAAIAHAAMPDYPESAETLRERDRAVAAGGGTQVRWLAEGDAAGEVLAAAVLGHFTWCADPTIKGVGLRVVPSARGRGIGRALHDTIIAAAEADATRLLVGFVDSRESRSCAFAEAAGYRLIGRALESHIEPHQVDLERFAEVAGNARRSGITIDRLADLSREVPDWVDRLVDLYFAVSVDVPVSVPTSPPSRDVFVAEALEGTMVQLEAFFIAREDGRWIGLTEVQRTAEDGHYDQELTGVLPGYRRRGIATALKLESLRWAQRVGATRVRTWNSSRNEGMLAVNRLLGYQRSHSIDEYHRPLGG